MTVLALRFFLSFTPPSEEDDRRLRLWADGFSLSSSCDDTGGDDDDDDDDDDGCDDDDDSTSSLSRARRLRFGLAVPVVGGNIKPHYSRSSSKHASSS